LNHKDIIEKIIDKISLAIVTIF